MAAPAEGQQINAAVITGDAAVLGLLAIILGFVFWSASREKGVWKKFYSVIPAILPRGQVHRHQAETVGLETRTALSERPKPRRSGMMLR